MQMTLLRPVSERRHESNHSVGDVPGIEKFHLSQHGDNSSLQDSKFRQEVIKTTVV